MTESQALQLLDKIDLLIETLNYIICFLGVIAGFHFFRWFLAPFFGDRS